MTSEVFLDDETNYGPARVNIMGEPGTGKTSLAATFPNPYFLSVEQGAGMAKALRREIAPNDAALDELKSAIETLLKTPFDKAQGGIPLKVKAASGREKEVLVQTLVIDSMDAIQQSKRFAILGTRNSFEQRDWGKLYDLMYPVVLKWNALPIHVVVICHVKETRPDEDRHTPGAKTFALQGAFRDQLPRWFRYILHLEARENGQRVMYTQPTVANNLKITAKDTYRLFSEKPNPMPVSHTKGVPTSEIADAITALHTLDGRAPVLDKEPAKAAPAASTNAKGDPNAFWAAVKAKGMNTVSGKDLLATHGGDFTKALEALPK